MIPSTTKQLMLNPTPVTDETPHVKTLVGRVAAPPAGAIEHRLRELDREWDAEHATAVVSGLVLIASVGLIALLGEEWLVLPLIVGICQAMHGFGAWTPDLGLMRRLGIRSSGRIARERHDLQAQDGEVGIASSVKTVQDREDLSRFENEGGAAAATIEAPVPDSAGDFLQSGDRGR